MSIQVCTINPLGQGFQVPFGARFRITLRGLFGLWGSIFRIPVKGYLVSRLPLHCQFQHTLVRFQFDSLLFFLCFFLLDSKTLVAQFCGANHVVFGEIVRQVFVFFLPEYVEMILFYYIAHPIKSHVYCYGYFLFGSFIHDDICRCVVCFYLC